MELLIVIIAITSGILVPLCLFNAGNLIAARRERVLLAERTEQRFVRLELVLARLETQMGPFWVALQSQLTNAMHRPHPEAQELDDLLEQLEADAISDEARGRLREILAAKVKNPLESEADKAQASALLTVMPLVVVEKNLNPAITPPI